MKPPVDSSIQSLLELKLLAIEEYFVSDVFTYYVPIVDGNENIVLDIIENLYNYGK